ncbi:hypothetical protein CKO15_06145 [Halorhodospira abdelmalekii]|uniref:hypothetical protein n=1 Tax=Halorhodospira abdelmalekii TaxID=421629 RepID=UPI00190496DE|nr:hypothetical protein [Halorhodospira abdelmalekii]MBK1734877.1 hypothetical protein [Halorhodospira abdelmalekii]
MGVVDFDQQRRGYCAPTAWVRHPLHGECEVLDYDPDHPLHRMLLRIDDGAWVRADVRDLIQVEPALEQYLTGA